MKKRCTCCFTSLAIVSAAVVLAAVQGCTRHTDSSQPESKAKHVAHPESGELVQDGTNIMVSGKQLQQAPFYITCVPRMEQRHLAPAGEGRMLDLVVLQDQVQLLTTLVPRYPPFAFQTNKSYTFEMDYVLLGTKKFPYIHRILDGHDAVYSAVRAPIGKPLELNE